MVLTSHCSSFETFRACRQRCEKSHSQCMFIGTAVITCRRKRKACMTECDDEFVEYNYYYYGDGADDVDHQ